MTRRDKSNADPGTHNQINPGTRIEGTMHSEESMRLDGHLMGDIHCQAKVVIGPEGMVQGKVFCQELDLHGKIQGDVVVKDTLLLRSTGLLDGNIQTSGLSVEIGGRFEGNCTMKQTQDA